MDKAELKAAIVRVEEFAARLESNGARPLKTDLEAILEAARSTIEPETPCRHCYGTGDVHRTDGEYLGECDCGAISERREVPTVEFKAAEGKISLYPKIADALAGLPDNGIVRVPLEIGGSLNVGRLGATVPERSSRDYQLMATIAMAERRILRIEHALKVSGIDVEILGLGE